MTDVKTGASRYASIVLPLVVLAVVTVVVAGLVFLFAIQFGWTLGWIYVGIMAATIVVNWLCLLRWNPDLIERRMHYGEGWKTWDKVWFVLFVPAVIAVFVTPVLEGCIGARPGMLWLMGLAIFIPAWALAIWAMVENPFFEKVVRIQTDHRHRVIDTGPYAFVRHPGYVGFVGWILSTPLLLGSTWGFVPALISMVALIVRTALEDRTLQAELPGYAEYATNVQFRLIPGFW